MGRADSHPQQRQSHRPSFDLRSPAGRASSASHSSFLACIPRAVARLALGASVLSVAALGLVAPVHAGSDGDLRLMDGPSGSHGRLEVFHDGQWGGVCDDFFTSPDATVACRQLGYTGGETRRSERRPLSGGMSFWLDNVGCAGTESRLDRCRHRGWGNHNCSAREAISVVCTGSLAPAPQNVTAQSVAEHGQVTLTWAPPRYDGTIAGYQVRYGVAAAQPGDEWEEWSSVPNGAAARSHTFTGLSNFTLYGFQVRAMAGTTPGIASEPTFFQTDGPRVRLIVSGDSQNDVHGNFVKEGASVTIDAVLTAQPPASVSVSVESEDSGALAVSPASLTFTTSNWNVAQAVTATAVQDSDSDNEYHVAVTLAGTDDEIPIGKGKANVTVYDDDPAPPLQVTARPGDGHVTLSWTAPNVPYGKDEITGYEYRVCSGAAAHCSNDAVFGQWQSAGSSTSHRLASLDNGEAYSFQVRAVAGQNKGLASATVTATPGFHSPVRLTVGWVPPELLAAPASVQEQFWTGIAITGRPFPPLNGITAGRKLNFAAATSWASGVRSVKLELTGPKTASRTDSTAPFTLFESPAGQVMPAGDYTLKATSYSDVDAGGTAGTPKSVSFTLAADNVKPTVRVLCATPSSVVSPSPGKRLGVQVLFSELVLGFGPSDIEVTNVDESLGGVSASPTALPTPYSVDFTVPADATGAMQVKVPADAVEDPAGNGNTASEPLNLAQNRSVTVANAHGGEGSTMDFEVALDAANDCETVTVDYATADGTATAGADYTASSGTLTFGPGETTKTVSVAVMEDETSDSSETFTLQLSNAAGARFADAQATGTIIEVSDAPIPATGLTASNATPTTVDLAWTLPAQPVGVTVTRVLLLQQVVGDSRTKIVPLATDATSHTVTGLSANTSYSFRIEIVTSSGSAESDAVLADTLVAPKAATGLTESNVTYTTVDLSWTLPEQPEGVTVSAVEVVQLLDLLDYGEDATVASLAADATSHTVTGLAAGTRHSFVIRLVTNRGNADSAVVRPTTLAGPTPPRNLTASNETETTVDLAWTLPAVAEHPQGVTVTGVEVREETANPYVVDEHLTRPTTTVATLAADATSYTVTGLTDVRRYTYRIRLITNGQGHADSQPVTISKIPNPRPPTGLAASNSTSSTVDLSWTLPEQPERVSVRGIRVWQEVEQEPLPRPSSSDSLTVFSPTVFHFPYTAWRSITTLGADTTSHTVTGLTPETEYRFRISLDLDIDGATNVGGAGPDIRWSEPVSVTTLTGPSPATGLAASNATQTGVGLAWTLPAQPAGVTLSAVEVQQQGSDESWSSVATLAAAAASHTVTGLAAGTTYRFRVRLVSGGGHADSEPLAVATAASGAPTGLAATVTGNRVSLSFTIPDRPAPASPVQFVQVTREMTAPFIEAEAPVGVVTWERGVTGYSLVDGTGYHGRSYRYRVLAVIDGEFHHSAWVEVRTQARTSDPDGDETRAGATALDVAAALQRPWYLMDRSIDRVGGDAVDYYRFTLAARKTLGLGVRGQSIDIDVHLEDAQGNRIASSWPPPVDASVEWLKITLDAGTYYVRVEAMEDTPSGYYMRFGLSAPQPALSVADAQAEEGTDATLDFAVTLDRNATGTVTVDYATADGTATAGADYTATSGRLTFAAGERTKTVAVPVLDDALDEGDETLTLRLTNPQGAALLDGDAVGTISNDDPLQELWLSRFGRTAATHVVDAVSDRLSAPLTGAEVTLGGQRVDLARTDDEAWLGETLTSLARAFGASAEPGPDEGPDGNDWPGTGLGAPRSPAPDGSPARSLSGRELLLGSAFHLAAEGDGDAPGLAAWGRVTAGGFDGEAPTERGDVRVDGDVTTGVLGADATWDRLLAGVAVSVSEGKGSFAQPGVDSGTIESTMTAVSPYAWFMVNDRVSAWGLAGWGTGDMTIVQAANDNQPERVTRTDLAMRLAAVGGRGALMQAGEVGGIDLALKADAFYVETESEAVSNEGATTAAASRVRLALEGSRTFRLDGGGVLTPGLDVGLRHDGGDAETGTGVELGGRLTWADAGSGLNMEVRVRGLIAHEDSDYREWGASGSVRLDPGERGRGLSFSLSPTWGAASSGVEHLWSAHDARGLAPGVGDEFAPGRHLRGELGYGIALPGGFTGTPNLGFGLSEAAREYRIGWRLTPGGAGGGVSLDLDATRREAATGTGADVGVGGPPEHELMLRGVVHW